MFRRLFVCSLLLVGYYWGIAQQQPYVSDDPAYAKAIEKADSARLTKNYSLCLSQYRNAFSISQESYLSLYHASLCAAQMKDNKGAIVYLQKAIDLDWEYVCPLAKSEESLAGLRKYKKWGSVRAICDKEEAAYNARINVKLRDELAYIFANDQRYRGKMHEIRKKYGHNSEEAKASVEKQQILDAANLIRIEEIIAEYGYPGVSIVGEKQSKTAFLVIQHADLEVQEKYLAMLTEAADKGELDWGNLAMLIDRIRMRKGEKQLYGSQIKIDSKTGAYSLYPIENPAEVNVRRKKLGLSPIEEYVKYWGLSYAP